MQEGRLSAVDFISDPLAWKLAFWWTDHISCLYLSLFLSEAVIYSREEIFFFFVWGYKHAGEYLWKVGVS